VGEGGKVSLEEMGVVKLRRGLVGGMELQGGEIRKRKKPLVEFNGDKQVYYGILLDSMNYNVNTHRVHANLFYVEFILIKINPNGFSKSLQHVVVLDQW
jgi:hypothetical protein